LTIYLGYDIIPDITNRKENMQYFILKKMKLWGKWEYSTESKANHGYANIKDAMQKVVALETLNDDKNVSFILVNNGTPIERLEEDKEDKVVNI
tara:strand:+ start:357 stop:638 length:282 start_codon:yes stop_codon:yes gene_type:complete